MAEGSVMEDCGPTAPGAGLSPSSLRLLVPPLQLLSAGIWQTIQQRLVTDYGMLEEFVSMVTDIVPELLPGPQRAQLVLGLRARLVLEFCQRDGADVDVVQPHLDRMRTLLQIVDQQPNSEFVDLVKRLLTNPAEREHFFQNVFPQEFGATYDDALQSLMRLFLSRFEKFLPPLTFYQVASVLAEASSAVKDRKQSQWDDLKSLLRHQREVRRPEDNNASLSSSCILSALRLNVVETPVRENQQRPCSSGRERTCEGGAQAPPPDVRQKERPPRKGLCVFKECSVQLERLDAPSSSPCRLLRPNRGQRMAAILLDEKGRYEEDVSASSPVSPPALSVSSCHDDHSGSRDSWSHYSDEDSVQGSSPGSWSFYSSDSPLRGSPESSSSFHTPSSSSCNEDPSFTSLCEENDPPAVGAQQVHPHSKAEAKRRSGRGPCFICNEQIQTTIRSHMKTHFPNGDFACPQCNSKFKLLTSLQLHLKRICFEHVSQQAGVDKSQKLHRCDRCPDAFKYKLSLEAHQRIHHELYCSVCRRVLQDAATLERHKSSHTPLHCTRCDETFSVFKLLLSHCENVHQISRPFKCNHCPKTFSRLRLLIGHEWKHTGHQPFQCAQCGLRFRCDMDLVTHLRVHTREKPFLCAQCGKKFGHKSNLLRHLNFVHSEFPKEKKYACSDCERSFQEKGALMRHRRMKHFHESFRHPCPYCGKMFSASSIARHKLIHTGEKPFKCSESGCDKHFRSKSELKKHVRRYHSAERPFKCDVCGKAFIWMFQLRAHSKTHSGEKPFVCVICGRAFSKLHSMKRHKKLLHSFVIA